MRRLSSTNQSRAAPSFALLRLLRQESARHERRCWYRGLGRALPGLETGSPARRAPSPPSATPSSPPTPSPKESPRTSLPAPASSSASAGFHPLIALAAAAWVLWYAISRGISQSRWVLALLFAQLCASGLNLILMAPIWMQMLHLTLAYAFWIALVTLCSRDYANPPLRFNNR